MEFEHLKGWMKGEHCLVCAPGPSSMKVDRWRFEAHWTIGCNRAVQYCKPDFVVCVEGPMVPHIWRIIEAGSPLITFSTGERTKRSVVFPIEPEAYLGGGKLRLGMSPFHAAAVAIHLGFDRVGLVGVDYERADYPNVGHRETTEKQWASLLERARGHGVEIVNLNPKTRLEAIPVGPWSSMNAKGS